MEFVENVKIYMTFEATLKRAKVIFNTNQWDQCPRDKRRAMYHMYTSTQTDVRGDLCRHSLHLTSCV